MVNDAKPDMFTYAVVALTLVYACICYFTAFTNNHAADSSMVKEALQNEDIKSTLLEPLYYTFKTKSHRYKSSKFSLLDEMSDQVHSLSGESVIHYILWTIMALLFTAEFVLFNHKLADLNAPGILLQNTEEVIDNDEESSQQSTTDKPSDPE